MGSTQTKVLFQLGMGEAEEYEGLLSTDRSESDAKASDLQNLGHRRAVLKTDSGIEQFRTLGMLNDFPEGRGEDVALECCEACTPASIFRRGVGARLGASHQ